MRLDKFLSHTGFGSRKEVRLLLKQKKIFVNEKVQTKGDLKIDVNKDQVSMDGEKIHYQKFHYLMLHKPSGVLSATEDVKQKTVIDLLSDDYQHLDLFPVGRLDKDTEGLLLLTNDGELAHFLLSPKKEVKKVYFARVEGIMDDDDRVAFQNSILLEDGYKCLPGQLEIKKTDSEQNQSEVLITIQEGKFHQVKRMVKARGKEVNYLKRLSMGTLKLDPSLKRGEYRYLTDEELQSLKEHLPNN
ncbi:pseudouridine synthase [Jeotgalibaca ciconiae]|uniref:Pseudouridine synthase n=1 Tax=Jeotgalibaca ciconiae TaxID=2496265 RepID=A0A3Q9BM06_9LACT|nr:pseudouridine synthase [Jeotgalibaca ciconiae]AZP05535.1 rRNA pseudouridine synthase [Jeotgalibaca ciconiae]HJB22618.1 rRNA pseudouridine synthase [Candidatus Jeotgalibaca pullicola]